MKIFLLVCLSFFLAGCGHQNDVTVTDPAHTLNLADAGSMEFADFLKAAALLSQTQELIFRHPDLPTPVHFSSRWLEESEFPGVQMLGDEIRFEKVLSDTGVLREMADRLKSQSRLVDEPARVALVASEDPAVSFKDGLAVLSILAESGIDLVMLAQPLSEEQRSARVRRELQSRPSPPRPPRGR